MLNFQYFENITFVYQYLFLAFKHVYSDHTCAIDTLSVWDV